MDKPPNFLIVGAPKSGTTSLYRYLQQHPMIFMPENKEPRFFCGYHPETFEFGVKYFHPDIVTTEAEYLALFQNAPPGSITGEASTDYLSCAEAPRRIQDWNPEIKIIIILRNPLERAYSEYRHTIMAGFQTESFWESLCKEKERIAQRYDPIFGHVKRGLYFEAVREYMARFGEERVWIILHEDFARSTLESVQALFKFLGLPPHPVDVSERYAVNPPIQKQEKSLYGFGSFDLARAKGQILKAVRRLYIPGTQKELRRQPPVEENAVAIDSILTKQEYNYLHARFEDDILNLQQLLHMKLDYWL